MAKGDSGRELGQNLRHSVGLARELGANLGKTGQSLAMAGSSAGQLAAQISKAAGASKALASGLTLGLAALAAAIAGVVAWGEETDTVANKIAHVQRETAKLNALANNNTRLANEIDIADTLATETEQLADMEHFYRKFPGLLDAIKAKADAARAAAATESARTFGQAQFEDFGTLGANQLVTRGASEQDQALFQAGLRRKQAIDAAQRDFQGDRVALTERLARINEVFQSEVDRSDAEVIRPLGQQLGRGFAAAIADGIQTGIQTGDLGKGLRALTGGLLIAMGQMMQELGTKAILMSSLWATIVATFGTPAGLAAGIAMVAAGAAVEGLGQSLASSAGGGRSAAAGGSVYGSGQTVINRGLVNPAGSLAPMSNLQARPVILLQPTIFGTRDADAQRGFLEMYDLAMARRT